VSNDGPLGQPRGIGFGIIIFIITLGIYGLYWSFKTFDELQEHTKKGLGGGLALVIAVIVGVAIPFLASSEVGNMYAADGREKPVTGMTGLWILLPIIGGIVWFVKTQGALNRYWESKGGAAPAAAAA
jgi:hypothetical protein